MTVTHTPDETEPVTLTTTRTLYPPDVEVIEVIWKNDTDETVAFGEHYRLERRVNGEWVEIPIKDGAGFNDILWMAKPQSEVPQTHWIREYTDTLEPGEYRIATYFTFDRESGLAVNHPIYAEFTVGDADDPVTLTAAQSVYPPDVEHIEVTWKNGTDYEVGFVEAFDLEKRVNGEWVKLPMKDDWGFNDPLWGVQPHSEATHTYNLRAFADEFEPGEYRIKAEAICNRPGRPVTPPPRNYVYAGFTVGDSHLPTPMPTEGPDGIKLMAGKSYHRLTENLTEENKLEANARELANYQLYTNTTEITVSFPNGLKAPVTFRLYDTAYGSDTVIQEFVLDEKKLSGAFTGLTSARNYFIEAIDEMGHSHMAVTISDR
jgi:hypothetical protein